MCYTSIMKYFNKKIEIDGYKFDSKAEGKYYLDLKLRKSAGDIVDFELQPEYVIQEKFRDRYGACREIKYRADFLVVHNNGMREIVDVKGFKTIEFKIKWKMMRKLFKDKEDSFILTLVD